MSTSANDGDDHGDIFLDEDDIVEEINVDEEGSFSLCPVICILLNLHPVIHI